MSLGRRVLVGLSFVGLFAAGALLAANTVDDGDDESAAVLAERETAPPQSSTTTSTTTTTTTTTTLPPPRSATLAFTGDLLPHGPVVRTAAAYHWEATGTDGWDFRPMFDEVRPLLSAADLAICHVESPVSSTDTNLSGYPVFNAPRALVEAAVDAGYDGCSTASNHAFDRRSDGVRSTIEVFEQLGLPQAGMAGDVEHDLAPVLYEVNDITLAHISATYSLNGFVMPDDEQFLVDLIEPDQIIAEAALAKEAGAEFVMVSLHWGNEYQHTPSAAQNQWLSEILPSDEVDLVIGHHAHVVQPVDKVDDEWVVFGLGNFLSNQSANCCVTASQDGMIAHIKLLENEAGVIEVDAVSFTPTWVDRSDGYVIRVANAAPGREGIADTLANSAARTAEVVMSRLGPDDGLDEARVDEPAVD
jgi:poly-gamma-glutamate synthesis protein (capsule biosynthesis protein)